MAPSLREISNVCRLCIRRDGLIPLSELKDTSFTIHDMEYYTGIQVSEEEEMFCAICDQCCTVLQKSVTFRYFCLSNDVFFKQLLCLGNEKLSESMVIHADASVSVDNASVDIKKDKAEKFVKRINMIENTQIIKTANKTQSTNEQVGGIDATELKVHVKTNKKAKRKKHLCVECGQFVLNLTGHKRNHNKEKKYNCPHCQMKMTNATNMKRHIESVHLKKIIIICELCGKGFTHKNIFLSHSVSKHGVGQPYECKVCMKSFKQPSGYRVHMRKWHSVQKEFPCTMCNKLFKEKRQLTVHQRVHSADQPFACDQCPKRFKSQYARKNHQLTHSGIRFSCTLCVKSYKYKSLLTIHCRKAHPDKNSDNLQTDNTMS